MRDDMEKLEQGGCGICVVLEIVLAVVVIVVIVFVWSL